MIKYIEIIESEYNVGGNTYMIQFIEYPKCTTCKKAKKWLEEQQISFQDRHIKEENPTEAELQELIEKS